MNKLHPHLGFIGAGNMAGAILRGIVQSGFLPPENIYLFDINAAQQERWQQEYPALHIATDTPALVRACDYIILAVKPVFLEGVLQECKPFANGKIFVSIAAGWSMHMLTSILDQASGARVLRVMPNTPAMVGKGFTALCQEHSLDEDHLAWVVQLLQTFSITEFFSERLFDAVIAVSGSSPAYAYMMLEAMANGAVRLGMPAESAFKAAAQAMLGAATMVLETGEHPAKLKDAVCSPGGTTIEAVASLEKSGFRSAVMEAMDVCAAKSRALEQSS